ncbi:HNH endonuclease signature motif containing protein [Arthrobacter sp. ISL-72]|uniref:HNH endonuclease signature motif containing protein n=1 Tax=Arthrobacter sp. ISL-72 TaxID=2819114 RepID=UPI001BE64B0A|nr:HNH endonuclease signature motif containing protein [Arthrobacter sp. ISL-72]MBT2594114.1 DUF222 domain-containing protein [Arthrobacter sp. ISL-72]
MEAMGELAAVGSLQWAGSPVSARGLGRVADEVRPTDLACNGGGSGVLFRCLELLRNAGSTAVADAALFSFGEAVDFAAGVEEISRSLEFLQVVAAGAVDRTRRQAVAAGSSGTAVGWTTGWDAEGTDFESPEGDAPNSLRQNQGAPNPADDGCRNAAEVLRSRLRISAGEARRRIALAGAVLPRTGFTGHEEPPERPELGCALAVGTVGSRAATIITLALDQVRHHAPEETTVLMEHALVSTAAEDHADFLSRMARRWIDAIDQDGTEPSEEELRHRQGAFIRRARRGLHHVEIFATPDQYEHLLTVMNTATNPRTRPGEASENNAGGDGGREPASLDESFKDGAGTPDPELDLRTLPQRRLDGLVSGCKAALASGKLPAAGGLRPQVMATIDYRDLLNHLEHATEDQSGTGPLDNPGIPGTGTFTFTGPVTAATVRKIACDADIIPVLLGSEGRVLDIGRTTRVFPPHIRKAITARDQGCAFPACTIPAPWCEAHHITYWSHNGATSTENGTLLCSHHHHLIHKEQWTIQVKTGIPWFIPPPHIDPRQKPQRNRYFRC